MIGRSFLSAVVFGACTLLAGHAAYATECCYDQFPDESCALSELAKKAEQLRTNDCAGALLILDEIKRRILLDPVCRAQTCNDANEKEFKKLRSSHPPFDDNRAGKTIPHCYVNGSLIHTPRQQFLVFECPRKKDEVENLFDIFIDQNVQVIVSLTQTGEPDHRCHDFWLDKTLHGLKLRSRWSVKNISRRILAQDEKVTIVESVLEARNGDETRSITHLHYDGWRDFQGVPSYEMLGTLLDRIKTLQSSDVYLAVHCKAGLGRSGVTALSYYLEKEIDYQLASGRPLDDIRINVPEALYLFRQQRSEILGDPDQFSDVYIVLSKYYDQLVLKKTNAKEG
jgi:protein tyrosine phosphatase